jgi:hypothetical protein
MGQWHARLRKPLAQKHIKPRQERLMSADDDRSSAVLSLATAVCSLNVGTDTVFYLESYQLPFTEIARCSKQVACAHLFVTKTVQFVGFSVVAYFHIRPISFFYIFTVSITDMMETKKISIFEYGILLVT